MADISRLKQKKFTVIISVTVLLITFLTLLNLYANFHNMKKTVEIAVATQGMENAKSIVKTFDKLTYEEFLKNPVASEEFYKLRRDLNQAREHTGALHVYTVKADEQNIPRVMVAGFPENHLETHIGKVSTIPEEYINKLVNGKLFYTGIIPDDTYGSYVTAGVPIYSESNKEYLGALAVDISAETVNQITKEVVKSSIPMFIFNGLFVLISFAAFLLVQRWVRVEIKSQVGDTEETYQGEFTSMLHTLKSIRHDFINHIQVIQGLLKIGLQDRAYEYVTSLTKEVEATELPVKVKNPAMLILLQSKWVRAQNDNVDMHLLVDDDSFSRIKSTDLIKLLSNLIDNAFDATLMLPETERFINYEAISTASTYQFKIENIGRKIPDDIVTRIFQSGFSTKETQLGSPRGEGLSIVKQVVEKYGGAINVQSEDKSTTFFVTIPVKREK
ncbi:sensor histidine kinase [Metabacillus herbersteinensis]|uniref:histidine kinase n=1 Tax=Metabacillus herbersteinensis TaxID=283816 RepID=A0ABV6GDE2_9BACI